MGWTNHEVAALERLYPTASWLEITDALPRHTKASIKHYAAGLRLHRVVSHIPHPEVDPLVLELIAARMRAGFTQTVLAQLIGVDRSVLNSYELGRRHLPATPTVQRWCAALGLRLTLSAVV